MWDLEHKLYNKLGVSQRAAYVSEGTIKGANTVAKERLQSLATNEVSGSEKIVPEMGTRANLAQNSGPILKGLYHPTTKVIELVRGRADVSTVVHEVGHFFHEVLTDHSEYGSVIKKHYGDIMNVSGAEQFARHFENYLREGVAPSRELRTVFAAMKDWMGQIYSKWKHGSAPQEVHDIFNKVYSHASPETKRLASEFNSRYSMPKK
jgi:hypothetical protein